MPPSDAWGENTDSALESPALIKLGVPDFAAYMSIFYYAVLSEVSPPTALIIVVGATQWLRKPAIQTS